MGIFVEQKVMSICMLASYALGVFIKAFIGMYYDHLIKEADNMATTENKQLKQCKVKFSNCYEMNNGMSNVQVFVEKFLGRLSVGPIPLSMTSHLSGQLILVSVVFSGIAVCKSILMGCTLGQILPFYIASFGGLYFYFSVSTLADIKGKRRMLKVNLVDYLENHLSPRIHVTNKDMEMLYGTSYGEGAGKRKKTLDLLPIHSKDTERTKTQTNNQVEISEEELESLLKEFLIG